MKYESELKASLLELAYEIELSNAKSTLVYVDIGNLPKTKAEDHLKVVASRAHFKNGVYIPVRFNAGDTGEFSTVEVIPGSISLEIVLETAKKLADFVGVYYA